MRACQLRVSVRTHPEHRMSFAPCGPCHRAFLPRKAKGMEEKSKVYSVRLSLQNARRIEEYAEKHGYKSGGPAIRALALEGLDGGATTDAIRCGFEELKDEFARVASRGTLASLGVLMLECARADEGAGYVLEGLNAAETYEAAMLLGRMSLGQKTDNPSFYKLVSPALRAISASAYGKDALLNAMSNKNSKDVLFALDQKDVKPWLLAMREWRALSKLDEKEVTPYATLRRDIRAQMLAILADMGIEEVADAWLFETGKAYAKDAGWYEPDEQDKLRRRARKHGSYVELDENDPNWISVEGWW